MGRITSQHPDKTIGSGYGQTDTVLCRTPDRYILLERTVAHLHTKIQIGGPKHGTCLITLHAAAWCW